MQKHRHLVSGSQFWPCSRPGPKLRPRLFVFELIQRHLASEEDDHMYLVSLQEEQQRKRQRHQAPVGSHKNPRLPRMHVDFDTLVVAEFPNKQFSTYEQFEKDKRLKAVKKQEKDDEREMKKRNRINYIENRTSETEYNSDWDVDDYDDLY